jgi:anti-sigma factor (TIGR02949 family)
MTADKTALSGEREVAGLRCGEVLAQLSAYLDGELSDDARAHLEAHVRGCDACTRMGGEVAAVIRALRQRLGADPLPAGVQQRLGALLDQE